MKGLEGCQDRTRLGWFKSDLFGDLLLWDWGRRLYAYSFPNHTWLLPWESLYYSHVLSASIQLLKRLLSYRDWGEVGQGAERGRTGIPGHHETALSSQDSVALYQGPVRDTMSSSWRLPTELKTATCRAKCSWAGEPVMSHITQGRPGLELEEGPGSCSSPAPGSPGPAGCIGRAKSTDWNSTQIPDLVSRGFLAHPARGAWDLMGRKRDKKAAGPE